MPIEQLLQTYLQTHYAAPRVANLTNISQGWESDVYAFNLKYGPDSARRQEALILRIYPGEDASIKSGREYAGMRLLYAAGYPVPKAIHLEQGHSPLGKPFMLMEKIDGQLLWPLLSRGSDERRRQLLTLFCRLLVELHTLEWRPHAPHAMSDLKELPDDPYLFIDRLLEFIYQFYARFPITGFEPIFRWLAARRDQVPCFAPAPIHWDFHPANVLLRDDDTAVVIDWTQFEISDPRLDLAWTLMLVGSVEGWDWRDHLLAEYEQLLGAQVEQLAYFEVVACLKRLYSVAVSMTQGAEKLGMRPGAEAMMAKHISPLQRVYTRLLEHTAIRIPEMEGLIALHLKEEHGTR
jgi:aminoglycoside phosphotransferase (APT) family kinase protein